MDKSYNYHPFEEKKKLTLYKYTYIWNNYNIFKNLEKQRY